MSAKKGEVVPSIPMENIVRTETNGNDITNILVAREEVRLKRGVAQSNAEVKRLEKLVAEATEKVGKDTKVYADEVAEEYIKKIEKALSGLDNKPKITHSFHEDGKDGNQIVITFSTAASSNPRYYNTDGLGTTTVPLSSSLLRQKREIADTEKALKEAMDVAYNWRKELNDLPSHERQARAATSEEMLRRTKGGEQILENIEARIKKGQLALPKS